jgi:hypothetical protein
LNPALSFTFLPVVGFAVTGGLSLSTQLRKTKLYALVVLGMIFMALLFQVACGKGGGPRDPISTTYTITVTASSGSTSHSTNLRLAVR